MKVRAMRPSDGRLTGRQPLEVAHILQRHGDAYAASHRLPFKHLKAMHHISCCRTAMMGGHRHQCNQCGFERNAYNSCGDRHCPKCRTLAKERWLDARRRELLPTGYFHLVFTLPHDLNPVIHCNPRELLNNLFGSANETLQAFAADHRWRLEGQLGFVGVLHTWSQTLIDHFHLHCLVPAGVWAFDRSRWVPSRKRYLFRAKSLAKQFRKTYLRQLKVLYDRGELRFHGLCAPLADPEQFDRLMAALRKKQWIVYAKAPFAGPAQVLDYLGRYTHRVAIANHRLLSMDDGKVTFTYKDRSQNNRTRRMTLTADEFIRRFLFHRDKRRNIALLRSLMDAPADRVDEPQTEDAQQIMLRLTGIDINSCPHCGKGQMIVLYKIPRGSRIRDPP